MPELRSFDTKADAERFLDDLERAGGESVHVWLSRRSGRWYVVFIAG